jgi:acetoacetyl-CoA synthetase
MDEIPRWFTGARLNYAENLLRFNNDRIAIYSCSKKIKKTIFNLLHYCNLSIGEGDSSIKKMTFAELNDNVRRYRAALQHIGVTVGDRVVGTRTSISQ